MVRVQGLIDFPALRSIEKQVLAVVTSDGFLTTRLQGIEVKWSSAFADVALREGVLVIAVGRALDARDEKSGEAARWLERYLRSEERAAVDVGGGFAVTIVDSRRRRVLLLVDRFS